VEGDWQPYPGVGASRLPPVEPGRVVGLGALCDLVPRNSGDQSFAVSEFVTLEDGRHVILHEDRGFTIGVRTTGESAPGDPREHETLESLTRDVLNVVLPDDDESGEEHPWAWLAGLARVRGLDVTEDDLRGLPYEVVFGEQVRRWLGPD
jgi:hypothetical protein